MNHATYAEIVRETEKAYLVTVSGRRYAGRITYFPSMDIWVPKSQTSIHADKRGNFKHIAVPGWLKKKINDDFKVKTGGYLNWMSFDDMLEYLEDTVDYDAV